MFRDSGPNVPEDNHDRMVYAFSPMSGGSLRSFGLDISREWRRIKSRIGSASRRERDTDPDRSSRIWRCLPGISIIPKKEPEKGPISFSTSSLRPSRECDRDRTLRRDERDLGPCPFAYQRTGPFGCLDEPPRAWTPSRAPMCGSASRTSGKSISIFG